MSAPTATLYGSLTSPYARLCRIVREVAGVDARVAFEEADPFDPAYREKNPFGKVPSLIFADGLTCLETTMICRALMSMGTSLLPDDPKASFQEEADVAMVMGLLDLGVAFMIESRRPEDDQSTLWQERRLEGLHSATPLIDATADRAIAQPDGYAAAALKCGLDWLDFRLSDHFDWRQSCPQAASFSEQQQERPVIISTAPPVG